MFSININCLMKRVNDAKINTKNEIKKHRVDKPTNSTENQQKIEEKK